MSHYGGHSFNLESENDSWAHIYKLITPGSTLLDVGCANGNFGAALRITKKCKVTGIDIDESDLKIAKKQLDEAYLLDITRDDTTKLGRFDFILFADVIEHLSDPRATLKRVKKLLKKDGKILFSIPNMAHYSVRVDLLAGKFPYKDRGLLDKTHLHFYDADEVESVFNESGYNIVNLNPTVVLPTTNTVGRDMAKMGLRPTKQFYDMLQKTHADIFQFVGYAEPAEKTVKIKQRDYKMPHDLLREQMGGLESENNALRLEEKQLRDRVNNMSRRQLLKKMINKHHKLV